MRGSLSEGWGCPDGCDACLSRCIECKTYFVRSRSPKKDKPIYWGTYCSNCKVKGDAKRNSLGYAG